MPKLLLYCTKAKPYLYYAQESRTLMEIDNSFEGYKTTNKNVDDTLNGKIVAECDFEVEKIEYKHIKERDKFGILHNEAWFEYKGLNITNEDCDLLSKSNLTDDEIWDYLINKDGYAIHIKNLHIFDEPKELSDYYHTRKVEHCNGCSVIYSPKELKNAPQNMMYAFDYYGNPFVLISIESQEMCRIANKEQTIIVRKNVLKEMVE